jgi:DNA-binding MarR family transcriptional regulator
MRAVDIHSKKLERNYRLTGPQLIVLNEIIKNNQMPIGRLAKTVNLSNATITGIVDRLEKRGLLKRIRSADDRRQVLIQATETGQSTFRSAPPPLQEQFITRFGGLPLKEQNAILHALERTAAMMNAEDLDVGPILSGQPLTDRSEKPT